METLQSTDPAVRSLIIDDETDICALLGYILSNRNIQNECANNIRESKLKLGQSDFDFVFLDNYLPDGIGIEFVPYLRAVFPMLRIIMITSLPESLTKERLNHNGVDLLLPKPLQTNLINDAIDHLLEKNAIMLSKNKAMKRFIISFYFDNENVEADVRKSVVGTQTDYFVNPKSPKIISQYGHEITLFKENENFSVNTSSDRRYNDYVQALVNAILNQE